MSHTPEQLLKVFIIKYVGICELATTKYKIEKVLRALSASLSVRTYIALYLCNLYVNTYVIFMSIPM